MNAALPPETGDPVRSDAVTRLARKLETGTRSARRSTRCENGRVAGHGTDSLIGSKVADFRIVAELARGGMAVVYRARQDVLDRDVALKIMHPGRAKAPHYAARFRREASTLARLKHRGLVEVYAAGIDRGLHYLAMEYIAGRALSEELDDFRIGGNREHPERLLPSRDAANYPQAAATVALELAEQLDYVHERHVIHRDVKPANVLIDEGGHAWLIDFGLAKVLDKSSISWPGGFVGTPLYMSPEQASADGDVVDHRTDIFSLGLVLYEMLTFRRAFDASSSNEILFDISHLDPIRPRRVNARVPRRLEKICLCAIDKCRSRRYQSAGQLADDLRRFLRRRCMPG